MKEIKYFLSLLVISILFMGCSDDNTRGEKYYSGNQNYLSFGLGDRQRMIVKPEEGFRISKLYFGTYKNVSKDHQVKLVFDAENSEAVLGVDFEIINNVATLAKGTGLAYFEIKVFEDPAIPLGKKAIFRLESADLEDAVTRTEMIATLALSCQLDNEVFPMKYNVDVYAFGDIAPSHVQTLTPVYGADENTYKFASAWGPFFVAWATDSPSYNNQYVYPGKLIINCDNTVTVIGDSAPGNPYSGGTGTYDPDTGVIDVVINQGVFTSPFTTNCVFTPILED